MKRWLLTQARGPPLGVVVPAYGVEQWLAECLDSLLAQTHSHWEAVVVDDGRLDRSRGDRGGVRRPQDPRISVVHTDNGGLGAARNVGTAHVRGDYLAFLDSDDVVPPRRTRTWSARSRTSGSDFATGSILRWEPARPRPGRPARAAVDAAAAQPAERGVADRAAPRDPGRRLRLEQALSGARSGTSSGWRGPRACATRTSRPPPAPSWRAPSTCSPNVVYHWRIRADGTSITQQRSSLPDLTDRWETKRMSLAAVRAGTRPDGSAVFLDRVLAGDLWRYFLLVPGCSDEWWALLRGGGAGVLGPTARWCTAACRPCTGCAAGWSSRTAAPTRPR